MKREIATEPDLDAFAQTAGEEPRASANGHHRPIVLDVADLLALDVPKSEMLIETILPKRGAVLLVGAAKSGKTLLATQMAIAISSGNALFENYQILEKGPALLLEQDDPAGAGSVKEILQRSPISVKDIPFFLTPRVPFSFGLELIEWLEGQIVSRALRLVVLDSYTALRSSRGGGADIVKAEQGDLNLLDDLAKRTNCTILIIHHGSKGAAGMDWTEQAAGTFAMSMATEAQIHISRFRDLDSNSSERLVRIRGRHQKGADMVLRFREENLDYEHVLEGGAAPDYPVLVQLKSMFGTQAFGPKELSHSTGVSRATANRQIDRLYRANALTRRGYGEYVVNAND